MKLSQNNPFRQIFIFDYVPFGCLPQYDKDPDIPTIYVSDYTEIRVIDYYLNRIIINPLRFDSEEQFNSLALQCIIKANEIAGKTFNSINDVNLFFESIELSPKSFLTSKNTKIRKSLSAIKLLSDNKSFYTFDGIEDDAAYILPPDEYFGVINEITNFDNIIPETFQGIGVFNSVAVVKLKL